MMTQKGQSTTGARRHEANRREAIGKDASFLWRQMHGDELRHSGVTHPAKKKSGGAQNDVGAPRPMPRYHATTLDAAIQLSPST